MNTEKLALGTVQFGLDYGISNRDGKVKFDEITKILDYARDNGIDLLDTAQDYGDSEFLIGKYIGKTKNDFKVVTKLSKKNNLNIFNSINQSLANLNASSLYAVLIHDFNLFISDISPVNELHFLIEDGKIEKYGFSLYYPRQLDYLLENEVDFDIVQIPYSIFDRRFESYFEKLYLLKKEIHVRSVFLQGLVFLNTAMLAKKFASIKDSVDSLYKLSAIHNIPLSSFCLNFVLLNKFIGKVIIGVDSLKILKENIESMNEIESVRKLFSELQHLQINDENVLVPSNW